MISLVSVKGAVSHYEVWDGSSDPKWFFNLLNAEKFAQRASVLTGKSLAVSPFLQLTLKMIKA